MYCYELPLVEANYSVTAKMSKARVMIVYGGKKTSPDEKYTGLLLPALTQAAILHKCLGAQHYVKQLQL